MTEQVVQPRIRGYIATNAHPDGCAANVRQQITIIKDGLRNSVEGQLKNALIVGSSTGYGLATTLSTCFGLGAKTLGVCFERPSTEDRTGSAGWYNLVEAHRIAREEERTLATINGDAFSRDIKSQATDAISAKFGKLDLLVYSLAAPRREDEDSNAVWNSVLKPIGEPYTGKAIELGRDQVFEREIEPATDEEIYDTIRVMGGDDWAGWVDTLRQADLLAEGFRTVAFSYIGPETTDPIYRAGTIGRAKQHLEETAHNLRKILSDEYGGDARISVNKAVVTQASAAIPVVALYMSILFAVMKRHHVHEGPAEQMVRLFREHIISGKNSVTDDEGRIRLDDLELNPAIQAEVTDLWNRISTENLYEISDYSGYYRQFRKLFGFDVDGIE